MKVLDESVTPLLAQLAHMVGRVPRDAALGDADKSLRMGVILETKVVLQYIDVLLPEPSFPALWMKVLQTLQVNLNPKLISRSLSLHIQVGHKRCVGNIVVDLYYGLSTEMQARMFRGLADTRTDETWGWCVMQVRSVLMHPHECESSCITTIWATSHGCEGSSLPQ